MNWMTLKNGRKQSDDTPGNGKADKNVANAGDCLMYAKQSNIKAEDTAFNAAYYGGVEDLAHVDTPRVDKLSG